MVHQRCSRLSWLSAAVVKNGDWNDFFTYYIDSERDRLYPTVYERVAPYQKAA